MRTLMTLFATLLSGITWGQVVSIPSSIDPSIPVVMDMNLRLTEGNVASRLTMQVRSVDPLRFAENLEVRLKLRSSGLGQKHLDTIFPIALEEGFIERSYQFNFTTPLADKAEIDVTIEALRGGVVLPGFSTSFSVIPIPYGTLAVIEPESPTTGVGVPDLRGYFGSLPQQRFLDTRPQGGRSIDVWTPLSSDEARRSMRTANLIRSDQCPTRWADYIEYQAILVHATSLEHLVRERPNVWRAIRGYLLNGGQLLVYGESTFESLTKHLGKPQSIEIPAVFPVPDIGFLFAEPTLATGGGGIAGGVSPRGGSVSPLQGTGEVDPGSETRLHPYLRSVSRAEFDRTLAEVPFGTGRAVAIEFPELFDVSYQHWQSIHHSGRTHRSPLSLQSQSLRASAYFSPKLGSPPIVMFWFFITGFVLVVGPLLYLYLHRMQRLYRIYFWVPLIALFVGTSTLVWAVIAEGFSEKYVTNGLTYIDSGRGRSDFVTESWYSPRGTEQPLVHASDELAIPLEITDEDRYRYRRQRPATLTEEELRRLRLASASYTLRDDGNQRAISGEILKVREQHFFARVRSEVSDEGLTFVVGQPSKIRSRLNEPLRKLIVSEPGKFQVYWRWDELRAGTEQAGVRMTAREVSEHLNVLRAKLPFQTGVQRNFYVDRIMGLPIFRPSTRGSFSLENHPGTLPMEIKLESWHLLGIPEGGFIAETDARPFPSMSSRGKLIEQVQIVMGRVQ